MRAALLVTLVALAGSARADNCKDDKQKLANFFRDVDKLGADAMQLAAKCIYEGSDDAGLDKLVKAMKTLSPPEGRAGTCSKTKWHPAHVFKGIGESMGVRLSIAYRACSSKAQAKFAELEKKKATDDDIDAELGKMASAFFDEAMK
jgi:hypothetical protein